MDSSRMGANESLPLAQTPTMVHLFQWQQAWLGSPQLQKVSRMMEGFIVFFVC